MTAISDAIVYTSVLSVRIHYVILRGVWSIYSQAGTAI